VIGVIAALVVGWQVAAFAEHETGHELLTLPGSDFEIDLVPHHYGRAG
jgi:hypothetical protein